MNSPSSNPSLIEDSRTLQVQPIQDGECSKPGELVFLKNPDSYEACDASPGKPGLALLLVQQAKQKSAASEAIPYLKEALELDPNCAEACFEMGNLAGSAESSMMWYDRCMRAAACKIGQEEFSRLLEAFRADPWKQPEMTCWVKAKVCLAERLFHCGFYGVAIIHFKELMFLNPADDLGIRYYLLTSLLCEDQLDEVARLIREYRLDWSPCWFYGRAFLKFLEEGDTRKTRRILGRAFTRNLWIAIYLTGLEPLPEIDRRKPGEISKPFREGSQKEAAECITKIAPAFCKTSELTYWVWNSLKELANG